MGALLFPDRVSGERYDFARHRDGNPPGDFSRGLAGSCGRLDTTVRTHALRHLDQRLTPWPRQPQICMEGFEVARYARRQHTISQS